MHNKYKKIPQNQMFLSSRASSSHFKPANCFVQLTRINLVRAMSSNLLKEKAYVNGEWVSSHSGKTFQVTNPANGNIIGLVPDMDATDTEAALNAANEAFKTWKRTTAKERSGFLKKWYELMQKNCENIAKITTMESGKPLLEAKGEVVYGNSFINWFAEEATRVRGEIIPTPVVGKMLLVEKQPAGVASLIAPWNFPHAMITRKAGAALAAGCTCVIKPAEDTPLTALALAQLAHEAGFPKGVVNVITCNRQNAPQVGKMLCQSPWVGAVSFTGSTTVGKILYSQCAFGVKKLALELGGNAPFIVFKSANLDNAITGAVVSKFRNCGQTCVSANRFLVAEEVFDVFVAKLVEKIKLMKQGDGFAEGIQLGPLINQAQFDKISGLVTDALSKGAKAVIGGAPNKSLGGLYYEPTLLVNVTKDMRVYNEEVFGPIVTLIKFQTEAEALAIANGTDSGLAGYFYTEDIAQVYRVARQLEVGMVGANEGMLSTAEAPFGGVKQSGLGREGSHNGIEDFVHVKYICIGNLG